MLLLFLGYSDSRNNLTKAGSYQKYYCKRRIHTEKARPPSSRPHTHRWTNFVWHFVACQTWKWQMDPADDAVKAHLTSTKQ
mmetsp:Transcript_89748/g.258891  ORF Transcript_89748/g.258891 Transcript_89748/m.258891 type:complete len:81 (-) Transcript_89748:417-659(-)